MKSPDELRAARCRPISTGALADAEVAAQLQAFPDWHVDGGAIVRAYRFGDYYRTIAFVNALAFVAHAEDHHPQLLVAYNRCEVRFSTHSAGGITENDFICAARADALYAQHAASAAP